MRQGNIIILTMMIMLVAISGCTGTTTPTGEAITSEQTQESIPRLHDTTPEQEPETTTLENIVLTEEGPLSKADCYARGLQNRVIVIESRYCSACQALKPILAQISQEQGINIEFLDRTLEEDREKQEKMMIQAKYTPTVIANCNVYIGTKSKVRYTYLLRKDLEIE